MKPPIIMSHLLEWPVQHHHAMIHGHTLRRLHRSHFFWRKGCVDPIHWHFVTCSNTTDVVMYYKVPCCTPTRHLDDASPEPVIAIVSVELNQDSLREIFQTNIAPLSHRVMLVLKPIRYIFPIIEDYLLHLANRILHKLVLRGEFCREAHAHANKQRAHTKAVTRVSHANNLQRLFVFVLGEPLPFPWPIKSLHIKQHLPSRLTLAHCSILHQTPDTLPNDSHLIPLDTRLCLQTLICETRNLHRL